MKSIYTTERMVNTFYISAGVLGLGIHVLIGDSPSSLGAFALSYIFSYFIYLLSVGICNGVDNLKYVPIAASLASLISVLCVVIGELPANAVTVLGTVAFFIIGITAMLVAVSPKYVKSVDILLSVSLITFTTSQVLGGASDLAWLIIIIITVMCYRMATRAFPEPRKWGLTTDMALIYAVAVVSAIVQFVELIK